MYDREGGHFFDLGSAELIANGKVKVKCDALPAAYTETGLQMDDGSHIDADVIVLATGYTGNIRDTARKIFGDKIGDSLEEFWQCNEEGESVSSALSMLQDGPVLTVTLTQRGAWKYIGRKCTLEIMLPYTHLLQILGYGTQATVLLMQDTTQDLWQCISGLMWTGSRSKCMMRHLHIKCTTQGGNDEPIVSPVFLLVLCYPIANVLLIPILRVGRFVAIQGPANKGKDPHENGIHHAAEEVPWSRYKSTRHPTIAKKQAELERTWIDAMTMAVPKVRQCVAEESLFHDESLGIVSVENHEWLRRVRM